MVLTYSPTIVFSGYAYMFAIAFAISYGILHDLKASLLVSLVIIFGLVAYRYNHDDEDLKNTTGLRNTTVFVFGLVTVFVASNFLEPYKNSLFVDYTLYGAMLYCTASTLEWFSHRYVMHCYQNTPWILNLPDGFIKEQCLTHKRHHLSVKEDMSLRDTSNDGLLFNIKAISVLSVITFVLLGGFSYYVGIKGVNVYTHAAVCVLAAFAESVIWNSIHTKMHDREVSVSFVPKIDTPESVYKVYLKNHDLHHQIKGTDKGNFNVVVLGADEIFQTNNKEK